MLKCFCSIESKVSKHVKFRRRISQRQSVHFSPRLLSRSRKSVVLHHYLLFLLLMVFVLKVSSTAPPSSSASMPHVIAVVRDADAATNEQIDEFLSSTNYDIQIPINGGQSALVDKETGRVYWQSGGPAIAAHDVFGETSFVSQIRHAKSILLSTLLWTCLLTILLVQRLWDHLFAVLTQQQAQWKDTNPLLSAILSFLTSLLLFITKPKFTSLTCNPCFVAFIYVLYLLESYTCSTRRYLENITSQQDVEDKMETLRNAKPSVTWNVRCYHYETPSWTWTKSEGENGDNGENGAGANVSSRRQVTKKVITHRASKQFEFER